MKRTTSAGKGKKFLAFIVGVIVAILIAGLAFHWNDIFPKKVETEIPEQTQQTTPEAGNENNSDYFPNDWLS